jgi:uncharacterized protein YaaR (DUF327 family)
MENLKERINSDLKNAIKNENKSQEEALCALKTILSLDEEKTKEEVITLVDDEIDRMGNELLESLKVKEKDVLINNYFQIIVFNSYLNDFCFEKPRKVVFESKNADFSPTDWDHEIEAQPKIFRMS